MNFCHLVIGINSFTEWHSQKINLLPLSLQLFYFTFLWSFYSLILFSNEIKFTQVLLFYDDFFAHKAFALLGAIFLSTP